MKIMLDEYIKPSNLNIEEGITIVGACGTTKKGGKKSTKKGTTKKKN